MRTIQASAGPGRPARRRASALAAYWPAWGGVPYVGRADSGLGVGGGRWDPASTTADLAPLGQTPVRRNHLTWLTTYIEHAERNPTLNETPVEVWIL